MKDFSFFKTHVRDLYKNDEIFLLEEMVNSLYSDQGYWTIVRKNSGLYVVNKDLEMYYLEFLLNWIIPSITMARIEYDPQNNKNTLYVYDIRGSEIEPESLIKYFINSNFIITSVYEDYKDLIETVDYIESRTIENVD